ncbi:hypothetical protein V2J09_004343 [Rumex salicifolius]
MSKVDLITIGEDLSSTGTCKLDTHPSFEHLVRSMSFCEAFPANVSFYSSKYFPIALIICCLKARKSRFEITLESRDSLLHFTNSRLCIILNIFNTIPACPACPTSSSIENLGFLLSIQNHVTLLSELPPLSFHSRSPLNLLSNLSGLHHNNKLALCPLLSEGRRLHRLDARRRNVETERTCVELLLLSVSPWECRFLEPHAAFASVILLGLSDLGEEQVSVGKCYPLRWMTERIGLGLTMFGVFFTFLGVIFLFDKGLLAMGNILFMSGLALTIGPKSTLQFFMKPQNFKQSPQYLLFYANAPSIYSHWLLTFDDSLGNNLFWCWLLFRDYRLANFGDDPRIIWLHCTFQWFLAHSCRFSAANTYFRLGFPAAFYQIAIFNGTLKQCWKEKSLPHPASYELASN